MTGAPRQIVTGQLNVAQDQRLDVAVACGVLTVLHGNGAGALGAPVPTALASSGSLAVGELTGGGGPELLTGAPTANAAADLLCFVVQPFELADIRCGNPAPVEDPPLLASTMQGPLAGTQTPIAANFSDPLGRRYDEVVGVNPLNTREVSVYGKGAREQLHLMVLDDACDERRQGVLPPGRRRGRRRPRPARRPPPGRRPLRVRLGPPAGSCPARPPERLRRSAPPRRTASSRTSTATARSTWWWRDSRAAWRSTGAGATARSPPARTLRARGGRDTGGRRPLRRPKAGHRPRHLPGLGWPVRPGDRLDQRDAHRATGGHAGPPAGQGHHGLKTRFRVSRRQKTLGSRRRSTRQPPRPNRRSPPGAPGMARGGS